MQYRSTPPLLTCILMRTTPSELQSTRDDARQACTRSSPKPGGRVREGQTGWQAGQPSAAAARGRPPAAPPLSRPCPPPCRALVHLCSSPQSTATTPTARRCTTNLRHARVGRRPVRQRRRRLPHQLHHPAVALVHQALVRRQHGQPPLEVHLQGGEQGGSIDASLVGVQGGCGSAGQGAAVRNGCCWRHHVHHILGPFEHASMLPQTCACRTRCQADSSSGGSGLRGEARAAGAGERSSRRTSQPAAAEHALSLLPAASSSPPPPAHFCIHGCAAMSSSRMRLRGSRCRMREVRSNRSGENWAA